MCIFFSHNHNVSDKLFESNLLVKKWNLCEANNLPIGHKANKWVSQEVF